MWIIGVTIDILKLIWKGVTTFFGLIFGLGSIAHEKIKEKKEKDAENTNKIEKVINGHKYYFTEKELEDAEKKNIELKEITVEDINTEAFKKSFAFYLNTGLCSEKTMEKWNEKYGDKGEEEK